MYVQNSDHSGKYVNPKSHTDGQTGSSEVLPLSEINKDNTALKTSSAFKK